MKHKYKINGATCESCGEKVADVLKKIDGVVGVEKKIDKSKKELLVEMDKHLSVEFLNKHLKKAYAEKYELEMLGMVEDSDMNVDSGSGAAMSSEKEVKSWKDYWPLILVFGFVVLGTVLGMNLVGEWTWMLGMRLFMGLFFLAFSFFKILDVSGFAMSYMSYDIVASKWMKWGYIYPFVELGFGVGYLLGWQLLWLNALVALVMGVSLIGVVKSVMNKRKIQCACLGTGFDLPMSTVTIVEDGAMVLMAVWMIINLI